MTSQQTIVTAPSLLVTSVMMVVLLETFDANLGSTANMKSCIRARQVNTVMLTTITSHDAMTARMADTVKRLVVALSTAATSATWAVIIKKPAQIQNLIVSSAPRAGLQTNRG